MTDHVPLDFNKLKLRPLAELKHLVSTDDFARPVMPKASLLEFVDSLPHLLAGNDLRALVADIGRARENKKPVIVMLGGHVIKCGIGPLIADAVERGTITHVAMNGAAAIHDFEVGMIGETSEDVGAGLEDGSYGVAEETGRIMNEVINRAVAKGQGIGECLGDEIMDGTYEGKNFSLLYNAHKAGVPVTVHIALGTDTIHHHPAADGSRLGEGTLRDFHRFAEAIAALQGGGVVLNLGCAVIMPEVFLKALTVARNLVPGITGFSTANFDMINHYRPRVNVVQRPTKGSGGRGYNFIGQHEILLPLLFALL